MSIFSKLFGDKEKEESIEDIRRDTERYREITRLNLDTLRTLKELKSLGSHKGVIVSTKTVYCIHGECDAVVIFYRDGTEIRCPKRDEYTGCGVSDSCPYED